MLDIAPETERFLQQEAAREGVSVDALIRRAFPHVGELAPADDTVRVQALLTKWQKEYGLPPRPDGKTHTTLAELFDVWEAEDANMTPEQIEQERQFWADYERRDRQPIEI